MEDMEHELAIFWVMEDMEYELVIFCNQAKLPVVGMEHQDDHKPFHLLQSALPARCAWTMMAQS